MSRMHEYIFRASVAKLFQTQCFISKYLPPLNIASQNCLLRGCLVPVPVYQVIAASKFFHLLIFFLLRVSHPVPGDFASSLFGEVRTQSYPVSMLFGRADLSPLPCGATILSSHFLF